MDFPATMHAMLLEAQGQPLRLAEVPTPQPGRGQVLLKVSACAVCRTDLHVVDGELPDPKLPLILGHQIVGRVVACGADAERFTLEQRVGVPWLGSTDGPAATACAARKTCASSLALPVIRWMAATPNTPRLTSAIAFRYQKATMTSMQPRYCAPD
jgi:propanol-preferring alcohol dehydrogenase